MAIIAITLFIYFYNKKLAEKRRQRGEDVDISMATSATTLSRFRGIKSNAGSKFEVSPAPSEDVNKLEISTSALKETKSQASINEFEIASEIFTHTASHQQLKKPDEDDDKDDDLEEISQEVVTQKSNLLSQDAAKSRNQLKARSGTSRNRISDAATPLEQKRSKGQMIRGELQAAPSENLTTPSQLSAQSKTPSATSRKLKSKKK